MLKKSFLILPLVAALFSSQITFAENRCLRLIDKRVVTDGTLDMSNCNLVSSDISNIVEFLKTHPEITKLNISGNQFRSDALTQLVNNTKLTELNVSKNKLDANSTKVLASSDTITKLDLSSNYLGDANVEVLSHDAKLTWLNLGSNNLSDAAARMFSNNTTTLDYLDLNNNEISDVGGKVFSTNSTLTQLILNSTAISDEGVVALAKMPHLKTLSLDGIYYLTPATMAAIAQNPSIKNLSLYWCSIGDEGAKALSTATQLENLNIAGNGLTNTGVNYLANLSNLVNLKLSENSFDDAAAPAIAKLTKLTMLDLYGFMPGAHGGNSAKVFATMPNLQTLYLGLVSKNVDDSVAIALANSKSLTSLFIVPYNLTEVGYKALAESNIKALTLYGTNHPSAAAIQALAQSKNLKSIVLATGTLDDDAIAELGNSTSLERLALWFQSTTIDQANVIFKNNHFTNLEISGGAVDDASSLNALANPNLTNLTLNYDKLSKDGIAALQDKSTIPFITTKNYSLRHYVIKTELDTLFGK